MRVILLIASVFLTSAKDCALDSSGAVANAIDTALNVWASTERCKPPFTSDSGLLCEQDVASTIQSVSATASAIAGILNTCGEIDESNEKCGWAVNDLLGATAGLAAYSGEVADQCAIHAAGATTSEVHDRLTKLGKCTVNSASGINSIFDASKSIKAFSKNCDNSAADKCIVDIFDVISVVSELGEHIAGSTAFCSTGASALVVGQEKCTHGILGAVSSLSKVAKIGLAIKKECSAESTRLYLQTRGESGTSASMLPIALAAFLPITAVLSVIAGLRLGKSRQHSSARIIDQEADELEDQ